MLRDMESIEYIHRAELRSAGYTRREITEAVRRGELIRARRDHYLPSSAADAIVRAVRVGGRLTCLSLMMLCGVFVLQSDRLHVHMAPRSSRMRSPHDRRRRLEPRAVRGVVLHWLPLGQHPGQQATVSFVDALAHAVLCQTPRAAVATLDSALYLGLIAASELREVFALLPARYAFLAALCDGRAESGPETLMRLMLRGLGCAVEVQVEIAGVGRVDLVVDGWLVIECDSKAHHSGWEHAERDRRRDLLLAALGFVSIRPTATMIMYEPELVLKAVKALLARHALSA